MIGTTIDGGIVHDFGGITKYVDENGLVESLKNTQRRRKRYENWYFYTFGEVGLDVLTKQRN